MTYQSDEYLLCDAVAADVAKVITSYQVKVVSDWRADRDRIKALEIRIMPAGWEGPDQWRDSDPETITIHVAVVGPADMGDTAAVDTALALANDVRQLWNKGSGPLRNQEFDNGWAYEPPVTQRPLINPDLLEHFKLFVAAIAVRYRRQD